MFQLLPCFSEKPRSGMFHVSFVFLFLFFWSFENISSSGKMFSLNSGCLSTHSTNYQRGRHFPQAGLWQCWPGWVFLRRNLDEKSPLICVGCSQEMYWILHYRESMSLCWGSLNHFNIRSHKPGSTPDDQANPVRDPKDTWSRGSRVLMTLTSSLSLWKGVPTTLYQDVF